MVHKHRYKGALVTTCITSLIIFALTGSTVNAQSINPGLDDIFQLRLGPFFANFESTVDVEGSPYEQEDLGDQDTTFAGFARWRITPKFHLKFGYSQISRDDSVTLASGTAIGGISVPGGSTLSQKFETSSLPISLEYAFVKNLKTEFGVLAGVNITSIKNSISISTPGLPTLTPIDQDITEPLPTIGLFWNQAFSPQWMLSASAGYMGLEIGGLDGNFYDAGVSIEWRPLKNVGFGASYLYTSADGIITQGSISTTFDYQFDGPFAYLMFGGGVR